jgi:hypothetical protein
MKIPYMDPSEAGALGDLLAAEGMIARSSGEIIQVEVRIKAQKTIRNLRVQSGEIGGDGLDLDLIHIAGY